MNARELSEAGVDTVDWLALGEDRRHRGGRAVDSGMARGIEGDVGAAIDLAPRRKRNVAGLQDDHQGSISTPGFIMPLGSSSRLAPRNALANSSGRCLS